MGSHRDRDRDHRVSSRSDGRSRKHSRSRRRSRERKSSPDTRKTVPPPRVPPNFICHICHRNHWTINCPRLSHSPKDYPHIDRVRGCWKCGQRGHAAASCTIKKYLCKECGGVHDTKTCYYDHISETWHEYFDTLSKHLFYANSTNEKEVRWNRPTHEMDVVLWHCPNCNVMIGDKVHECVLCHASRPRSVQPPPAAVEPSRSSNTSSGSSSRSGSSER